MGLAPIEKALDAMNFDGSKWPDFGRERDQHGRADQKPLSGSQQLELEIGEYRAWSRWGVFMKIQWAKKKPASGCCGLE